MGEEITYADLRFHDSSHVSTNYAVEKNPEVVSFEHKAKPCRYQKKMYIIIGLPVSILLLAVLAMTILFFQASEKQNDYRGRIQSISETLANVKNDLCMRNEGEQKDSCLLCPMNWVLIKKKCYYMPDKMLSWQESQRYCSAQNASLIMPKTSEEGQKQHQNQNLHVWPTAPSKLRSLESKEFKIPNSAAAHPSLSAKK